MRTFVNRESFRAATSEDLRKVTSSVVSFSIAVLSRRFSSISWCGPGKPGALPVSSSVCWVAEPKLAGDYSVTNPV
jgi:hypothetical protein